MLILTALRKRKATTIKIKVVANRFVLIIFISFSVITLQRKIKLDITKPMC